MNNSLLEKAQRDYPIGTEYIGIRDGDTETVVYTPRWIEGQDGNIEGGRDYIYRDGEWAKTVMPKTFEIGKWYRNTHWQSKAGKVESYNDDRVLFSEYISSRGKHMYFNFENTSSDTFIEVPLSEIQQYLPINHPDNRSNSIPEKWYMVLDGLSDKELKLCNEWRRSVCTIRKYSRLASYYTLLNCHPDESYYYGSDCVDTIKAESWANGIKEITFEQFKKYILKQENKEVMTEQKLTVSITDVLIIHFIACTTWKERIAKFLTRVDNDQNITFAQEEVDTMFEAATEAQLPTLENIFGKQVKKELTLKEIADGKLLFRENPNDGGFSIAMIEVRVAGSDKDKAFWLNNEYNWELKRDNDGVLCLVPTPKQ